MSSDFVFLLLLLFSRTCLSWLITGKSSQHQIHCGNICNTDVKLNRCSKSFSTVLHSANSDDNGDFDRFLGELVFSSNEPAYDIMNNYERASDPAFRAWLKKKHESSEDLEERVGLSSLADIIEAVILKVEESKKNKVQDAVLCEEQPIEDDTLMKRDASFIRSNEEVFKEVRSVQGLQSREESDGYIADTTASSDQSMSDAVRKSYEQVIKTIVDRQPTVSLAEAVEMSYEKCDAQFLTILKEKINTARSDEMKKVYCDIDTEVNNAMQRKMTRATGNLKRILTAGKPIDIEVMARKVVNDGEADDALVLLLEANLQQAKDAGPVGLGAAQLLEKIKKIIQTEVDSKADPEKRLLRQCLRETDEERLEYIIREAFRPRAKIALVDGGESSEEPLVTPPAFIGSMKNILLNFGNIGEKEKDFALKLNKIIAAAEKVATDLFGESMSAAEQQDRAWREHGASVWDLEKLENEAELKGETMPWANDKYDHILPNLRKGAKEGNFDIGGG